MHMQRKYRLLTNINFVSMDTAAPIQLHCHAILLEEQIGLDNKEVGYGQIRGFMTDGAMPVFTHRLMCKPREYEVEAMQSPHRILSSNGTMKPLFGGHRLTFTDGTILSVVAMDQEVGLEVSDYEGDITRVWAELPHKVLKHWKAPNIPVCLYVPVGDAPKYLMHY